MSTDLNVSVPKDTWINCFSYLNFRELSKARQVCKTWKSVIESDEMKKFLPSHPLASYISEFENTYASYGQYQALSVSDVHIYMDVSPSMMKSDCSTLPRETQRTLREVLMTYHLFMRQICIYPFSLNIDDKSITIKTVADVNACFEKNVLKKITAPTTTFEQIWAHISSQSQTSSFRICLVVSDFVCDQASTIRFEEWAKSIQEKGDSQTKFFLVLVYCNNVSLTKQENNWGNTFRKKASELVKSYSWVHVYNNEDLLDAPSLKKRKIKQIN